MYVIVMGGLGNQMFSYAFGEAVSAKRQEPVLYAQQGLGAGSIRAYSLDAFNVHPMKFIDVKSARNRAHGCFTEPVFKHYPEVLTCGEGWIFDGCWQSEKYFADQADMVFQSFQLRRPASEQSQRVACDIEEASARGASAFLHVRRTDYLLGPNPEFHGGPTSRYYTEAIERIRQANSNTKFFVFSDDTEWCRTQFPGDFQIVDHNKMGMNGNTGQEHEDLWLMSLCENAIVANSSFSWWGAWLGDQHWRGSAARQVIAPERWFKTPKMSDQDIKPERWIKLAN